MNNIKTHLLARPLGCFLALLIVLTSSYLTFGLSNQAKAQEATGNPSWAVLDFVNNSGYGGAEIGRQAADAFDVELYNTRKTEVVKRSDIADAVNHFGLQYPLDLLDLQRVGRYLEARSVVTGEVLTVSKSSDRSVEVTVAVRVNDVVTGELVNGALAKGTSVSRAGGIDEDAMVTEAIGKAAFLAISRIQRFTVPIATVMGYQGTDNVLLNKGSRDGYFVGLNLMTLRSGKETGQLRVGNLDSDSCVATVVNAGIGVQIADRCHALYKMPSYRVVNNSVVSSEDIATGHDNYSQKRAKFSKLGGILIAILAAAVLIYLVKRGNSNGSLGGAYVGSVIAQADNALQNSAPETTEIDPNENGIYVSWNYGNLSYQNVLCFNIYRNPTGTFSSGGTLSTTTVTGVTGTTSGTSGISEAGFTNIPVYSASNTSRIGRDDTNAQRYVSFEYVAEGFSGTTGSSGGSTSGGGGLTLGQPGSLTLLIPGCSLDSNNQYAVTAVYKTWDGYQNTYNYQETPVSSGMASGYATALDMIDNTKVTVNGTTMGSQVINVASSSTSLTIQFFETASGDDYVLDVATDSKFSNKKTYEFSNASGIASVSHAKSGLIFSNIFSSPSKVYFRVGTRHSDDVPGPYADPNKFGNPDTNPNGGNYLYEPYCVISFGS